MLPTVDQIRQSAFDRWVRRGRWHGFDRDDWFAAQDELRFSLNYQTIVEYPLDAPGKWILSDRPVRYCRFCERTAVQAAFGPPRPLLEGGRPTTLYTAAVCDDCQGGFRDALSGELARFRDSLHALGSELTAIARPRGFELYTLVVFKSLVACALAIMPESELRYFVDTLEWASNPDPDCDGALLLPEATCLVYSAGFLEDRSWTSLSRRTDKDVSLPYMVFFLAEGGIVLEVQVPLCIRDQDLDGRRVELPRRSFKPADGFPYEQARVWELRPRGSLAV